MQFNIVSCLLKEEMSPTWQVTWANQRQVTNKLLHIKMLQYCEETKNQPCQSKGKCMRKFLTGKIHWPGGAVGFQKWQTGYKLDICVEHCVIIWETKNLWGHCPWRLRDVQKMFQLIQLLPEKQAIIDLSKNTQAIHLCNNFIICL